jgi:uncharacterized protein
MVKGMKIAMTKRWLAAIVALLLLAGMAGAALGLETFKIDRYVTDRAGLLSESENRQLAVMLDQYARDTGNQILVITVPTLENREVVEFTEELFALNRPGQEGKDNGALLLVAKAERKIRIEVGYGLEEALPDGKAGTIIREEISPRFKAGDFSGGITAGVGAMLTAISPDYQFSGLPETRPARRTKRGLSPFSALVLLLIVIFSSIFNRYDRLNTRRRYRSGYSEPWFWGGGGFGGGGGGSDGFGGGGFGGGGGGFGGGGASGDW